MLAIHWDVNPEIIEGWKTPNYYGLLFVTGLILGYYVIRKMYKKANMSDASLDKLVLYMILATIIGARLGHVIFYGPHWDGYNELGIYEEGYFSHPLSILKVWEGGLASHGGAMAIVIALLIYSKRVIKKPFLWIFDRIAAPIAIAGTFIRLGNLMNSEIVGDPTDVPWAFEFVNYWNDATRMYDPTPRHPAQLYESICYLIIFGVIMYMFWKKSAWRKPGMLFGTFLILLFGARFLVEFVKLGQTAFDSTLTINTGQWLSIPFVLAGIFILVRSTKQPLEPESPIVENDGSN